MQTTIRRAIQILLGLLTFFLFGWGSWVALRFVSDAISKANPEVSAAIVGGMATVLAGLVVVLISQAHERRRASEEAHRLKKIEIYQGFVDIVARMIGASNEHLAVSAPEQKELLNFLFDYKSQILLWGSPEVVKAQLRFEEVSNKKPDLKELMRSVNALYMAIRKDIGLRNSGLNNLQLVKLYLNEEARRELD